jgi:hypothetical protein
VTEDEFNMLLQIRNRHTALEQECKEKGIPVDDVKHYWYKGENFSINETGARDNDLSVFVCLN